MTTPERREVLGTLTAADVRFVVVSPPRSTRLRLVVSNQPTNLAALGGALDRLGARLDAAGVRGRSGGARRVVDPLGALRVTTDHGVVELVLGRPGGSVYAEAFAMATERTLAGVTVLWAPPPPTAAPAPSPGEAAARRLADLVDEMGRHLGHATTDEE